MNSKNCIFIMEKDDYVEDFRPMDVRKLNCMPSTEIKEKLDMMISMYNDKYFITNLDMFPCEKTQFTRKHWRTLKNFIMQKDHANFSEKCSMLNEALYEIIDLENGKKILRRKGNKPNLVVKNKKNNKRILKRLFNKAVLQSPFIRSDSSRVKFSMNLNVLKPSKGKNSFNKSGRNSSHNMFLRQSTQISSPFTLKPIDSPIEMNSSKKSQFQLQEYKMISKNSSVDDDTFGEYFRNDKNRDHKESLDFNGTKNCKISQILGFDIEKMDLDHFTDIQLNMKRRMLRKNRKELLYSCFLMKRNTNLDLFKRNNRRFHQELQMKLPKKFNISRKEIIDKVKQTRIKVFPLLNFKQKQVNLPKIGQSLESTPGIAPSRSLHTSMERGKVMKSRNNIKIEKSTEAESCGRRSMLSSIADIAKRYSVENPKYRKIHNRSL
ncbi:unnamed protein product [Moneuplotes crassus]|uniref:Uncharacterized protein n=1 Tax=Euplotes crassus TaxID=5936 RepID=A0AAD1U871_EUPCR|nr:unnamed protein product [Moneuplotes crassus]